MRRAAFLATAGLASFVMIAAASDKGERNANELFAIVSAVRETARADRIVDPGAFSRERLEATLRNIDASVDEASAVGINWEREALLGGLVTLHNFDAVFSYAISSTDFDPIALRMQVTTCGKPWVLTIGFRKEDGLWRINSADFNSTPEAGQWYAVGMKPIRLWPHVKNRETSRQYNESIFGKAMGSGAKPIEDDCK
jgi:hypothetical protein